MRNLKVLFLRDNKLAI